MSRHRFALLALSLVALSLSACSDSTAPTAAATSQIKPSAQPSAQMCTGGTLDSTGKAC